MNTLKLEFYKSFVNSQLYGSTSEHMTSKVFFKIGKDEYECNVRQPYGENFTYEISPIEVETPEALKRQVNYSEFRNAVETYYRMLIGKSGFIKPGKRIAMINISIHLPYTTTINVQPASGGGW